MWIKAEQVASINCVTLQESSMSQAVHHTWCSLRNEEPYPPWWATTQLCGSSLWETTSNRTFQQEGNLNTQEMRYLQQKLLLLKYWRGENGTMQSVESVTLQQYLSVVMETAKELQSSQKRACKVWGFLLIIYCYGWYVWLYICHTKNILPYIVHFARWSYWRPLQGKLMLMDGGWKWRERWFFSISNCGEIEANKIAPWISLPCRSATYCFQLRDP